MRPQFADVGPHSIGFGADIAPNFGRCRSKLGRSLPRLSQLWSTLARLRSNSGAAEAPAVHPKNTFRRSSVETALQLQRGSTLRNFAALCLCRPPNSTESLANLGGNCQAVPTSGQNWARKPRPADRRRRCRRHRGRRATNRGRRPDRRRAAPPPPRLPPPAEDLTAPAKFGPPSDKLRNPRPLERRCTGVAERGRFGILERAVARRGAAALAVALRPVSGASSGRAASKAVAQGPTSVAPGGGAQRGQRRNCPPLRTTCWGQEGFYDVRACTTTYPGDTRQPEASTPNHLRIDPKSTPHRAQTDPRLAPKLLSNTVPKQTPNLHEIGLKVPAAFHILPEPAPDPHRPRSSRSRPQSHPQIEREPKRPCTWELPVGISPEKNGRNPENLWHCAGGVLCYIGTILALYSHCTSAIPIQDQPTTSTMPEHQHNSTNPDRTSAIPMPCEYSTSTNSLPGQ